LIIDLPVIALPMGMSSDKTIALPPSTQDALAILDDAERLFWADLAFIARTGRVPHVRDDAVSLALIKALQTSLGKRCGAGPALVVGLLGSYRQSCC
jgi:separase